MQKTRFACSGTRATGSGESGANGSRCEQGRRHSSVHGVAPAAGRGDGRVRPYPSSGWAVSKTVPLQARRVSLRGPHQMVSGCSPSNRDRAPQCCGVVKEGRSFTTTPPPPTTSRRRRLGGRPRSGPGQVVGQQAVDQLPHPGSVGPALSPGRPRLQRRQRAGHRRPSPQYRRNAWSFLRVPDRPRGPG